MFRFEWSGKEQAYNMAYTPSQYRLIDHTTHSSIPNKCNGNNTHTLIEGDNLEVLKLLRAPYNHRIKMIYIDPPYNTKSSRLLYKDTFISRRGTASHNTSHDNSIVRQDTLHSLWLNFMFPRLLLAQELLQEDGVICVSINDVEYAYLKIMMDEIFGPDNFVNTFVWSTTKGAQGMRRKTMLVNNHEYILVYAKCIDCFCYYDKVRDIAGFSNPDNDERGPWKRQYMQRLGQGLPMRTITDPATETVYSFESPYTEERINTWIAEGRIIFPPKPNQYPMRKEFLYEYTSGKQHISSLGLYPTKSTTEKVNKLFDGLKIFTSPKPLELIMYLVQACSAQEDIVMDFFAGSGTLGHAVLQLNHNECSKRKFICVQEGANISTNSSLYNAGYHTIFDICVSRIEKIYHSIDDSLPIQVMSLDKKT